MINKIKNYSLIVLLPLTFYPAYFLISITLDSLIGEQNLINWIQFESKGELIKTFISDWHSSLLFMYGVFFILILPSHNIMHRFKRRGLVNTTIALATFIMFASLYLEFNYLNMLANSLTIISIFLLSFYIHAYLTSNNQR